MGTWALKALRHLGTQPLEVDSGTRALERDLGIQALKALGHLATKTFGHLDTWTLGHSDTRTLRHSSTWALEALEELYIADSEHSPNESKTNMFSTNNSRGC